MGSRGSRNQQHSLQDRLKLFLERASQLSDSDYVKQGMSAEIKIIGDSNDSSSSNKPEEEQIRSFLLIFRHFISDSEPVFVYRILNDAYISLNDENYKKAFSEIRERLKHTMEHGPFGMTLDNEELTPVHALDLWINGYYFHSDKGKRSELEKFGMKPSGLAYMQLVLTIPVIVHYIFNAADIIRRAFDENVFIFKQE